MSTSIPTAQDDFSMRDMLDQTLKDFDVTAPPLLGAPAATPTDTTKPPMIGRTERAVAIAAVVFGLVAAMAFNRLNAAAPATMPQLTAAPAALLPTPIPHSPSPEAAMLPAFAAPNGARLGEIEATRDITPTAHYGDEWIQADVQGSGRIWLRASDWPALAIVGPDLAPRPTPTARPYVSPTPEPPRCETEADIKFVAERDVIIDGLPRGHAVGRSCLSQVDADAQADAQEQAVIERYHAHPTATTVPASTPMPLTIEGNKP